MIAQSVEPRVQDHMVLGIDFRRFFGFFNVTFRGQPLNESNPAGISLLHFGIHRLMRLKEKKYVRRHGIEHLFGIF